MLTLHGCSEGAGLDLSAESCKLQYSFLFDIYEGPTMESLDSDYPASTLLLQDDLVTKLVARRNIPCFYLKK